MLDRIGIETGWRCAELSCGGGGIMDLLSVRGGPKGHVVGLDQQENSLAAAQAWAGGLNGGLENVSFHQSGILDKDLPAESFDFVHLRFVPTTVGKHDAMVGAAARLLKLGGIIALQEGNGIGIDCFPPMTPFTVCENFCSESLTRSGMPPPVRAPSNCCGDRAMSGSISGPVRPVRASLMTWHYTCLKPSVRCSRRCLPAN